MEYLDLSFAEERCSLCDVWPMYGRVMVGLELWSFFWREAWLGLVEVEMLVSVELQRCLDVMEFLLQAVLVTGAESAADQCVVDSIPTKEACLIAQ